MRIFRILCVIGVALTSFQCAKTSTRLALMRPAEITVPQDIQTIVVLNRANPAVKDRNILEGVLSGETPGMDKAGVDMALNQLTRYLDESPRYKVIRANEVLTGSDNGMNFPVELPWSRIDSLCAKYQATGIIALETFDSDFIPTGARVGPANGGIPSVGAGGVASVNMGFRFYDPLRQSVLDQRQESYRHQWRSQGNAIAVIVNTASQRNQAVKDAAVAGAVQYGARIAPNTYWVGRTYYKGGDHLIKKGARSADVRNWEQAKSLWITAEEQLKGKKAGRAAHNVALAYEVLGDVYAAKMWADKAYTEYNNKEARDYARILQGRIYEVERLNEQMATPEGK